MTWTTASAATITTSFDAGHRDVVLNGYGTDGMGTFVLDDAGTEHRALCVEADVSHSGSPEAYSRAGHTIDSAELDALLWWLERQPALDDDTAVAAAALAWYYAGAERGGGLPVWADSARGFTPISPTEPHRWDALPALSLSHPVGLTSSGLQLDGAERRVAELHALATRLAPPWELSIDRSGRVDVRSGTGPLADIDVIVTVERPGHTDLVVDLRTDADGRAAIDLPRAPDGATLRATVEAPGRHQEWDGTDVQRMATATSETLGGNVTLPPAPRHIEVHKQSADPTIGTAGAVFELVDATGTTIERVTTSPAGVARFAPVDPMANPSPWSVVEAVAPPGLVRSEEPVALADASVDPSAPTIVTVVNDPATVDVVVQKRLTAPAGPPDQSGFEFTLSRRADGYRRPLATGDDGRTDPLPLALGTYDICETAVPEWAQGLVDGGCVELVIDLDRLASSVIEVDYLNVVPTPTIDTRAEDPADGDQTTTAGAATIVDRVWLDLLVPGTGYTVVGQIVPVRTDAAADAAPPPPATPATARETFIATELSERVDLQFDVTDAAPGAYVIVEWLMIGDEVVAHHHDLTDADQTFRVDPPPTTTTTTTTTTIVDTTTTTTTTPAPTTTEPPATVPATLPPATLPPTGSPEFLGRLLDWADAGFIVGVALVAIGMTRRRDANEAGC